MTILDLTKSKRHFWGKNKQKYEYQPLIKNVREEIINESDILIKMYRPPYLKLKIDMGYSTKAPKVVIIDSDDNSSTRNRIEPTQVDEIYNYIKYLSKVRFIVEINRVYALKNNNLNGKKNMA